MDVILFLVFSFIITWGIGITPALITRYAIVKKPLGKKKATKLAICFSASCFILFIVLHSLLDENSGNGLVWVIMFFVSRWIMTREGKAVRAESDNRESPSKVSENTKTSMRTVGKDDSLTQSLFGENHLLTSAVCKSNSDEALIDLWELFLKDIRIAAPISKDESLNSEYQFLKEWLGVTDDHFTAQHNARFIHEFQLYQFKSVGFDSRLIRLFQRFRTWLLTIQESLHGLNVLVSENVRMIFERIEDIQSCK